MDLWDDIPARARPRRPRRRDLAPDADAERERRRARAIALVRDGLDTKACVALTSNGLLPPSADVLRELRAKHPRGAPPDLGDLGPPPVDAVPDVSEEDVIRTVRSFPRGSAAGPSGLRPQHAADALRSPAADAVVRQLGAVSQLLARGGAHAGVAAHVAGGSLFAGKKRDGSARPLAAGDYLRRFTSRWLCSVSSPDVRVAFGPHLIGEALPLGTEIGAHSARAWCRRHVHSPRKVGLKVDFRNAHNRVRRATFLRQLRRLLPMLSPYMEYTYGCHSKLFFDKYVVSSEDGAQQGDPLAGIAWSSAWKDLEPSILAEATDGPGDLDLYFFFKDDGFVGADEAVAARFLQAVARLGPAYGFHLNVSKCELLLPAGAAGRVDVRRFAVTAADGVSVETPRICVEGDGVTPDADLLAWVPSSVHRDRLRVAPFTVLGSPVGSPLSCAAAVAARVADGETLLREVAALRDPQVALRLLRDCDGYARMSFAARAAPFGHCRAPLGDFDAAVRRTFESFSGCHPDATAWQLAKLPIRLGGLGLRAVADHAAPAWIASRFGSLPHCSLLNPLFTLDDTDTTGYSPTAAACDVCNEFLPADARLSPSVPILVRQRELSTRLDSVTRDQALLDSSPLSERERAHWRVQALPGAGAWLQAMPSLSLGLAISAPLFAVLLRRRMGLAVYDRASVCAFCAQPLDVYGDHAIACPAAGDRIRRHHRVRDALADIAAAAGHAPTTEPIGLLPPRPDVAGGAEDGGCSAVVRDASGSLRRPADVYFPLWWGGKPAALDVALTSALLPSSVAQAATDANTPLLKYDAYKRQHLRTFADCRDAGIAFVPFVMEAEGGFGDAALAILSKLAADAATTTGTVQSVKAAHNKQRISVCVARQNAVALARRRPGRRVSAAPAAAEARAEAAVARHAAAVAGAVSAAPVVPSP